MVILTEGVPIILKTILMVIESIFVAAWDSLPNIIELKKIASFFTPTNVLAICLGVPTVMVSILKMLSKIDLPQNDYS
jgi:hypothetical protein